MATGLNHPKSLVHAGTKLFFAVQQASGGYAVDELADQGGTPIELAKQAGGSVAADDQRVYWSGFDGIDAMPVDGGAITLVTADVPFSVDAIAADSTGVYWTDEDSEGFGHIMRFAPGATQSEKLAPQSSPQGLALDADSVYWIGSGSVHKLAKAGGQPEKLATFNADSGGPALDDSNVYWPSLDNAGTIRSVSKAGGSMKILLKGIDHPRFVAVDATHVYFTAEGSGKVLRIAKSDGTVEQMAVGEPGPREIALSDDRVFWVTFDGTIASVHK